MLPLFKSLMVAYKLNSKNNKITFLSQKNIIK